MVALNVAPCTPTIGADVKGVSLQSLGEDEFDKLEAALYDHKVLFVRDQFDLDATGLEALSRRFGQPLDPPASLKRAAGSEVVAVIETGGGTRAYVDFWHTDLAYREEPAFVSILAARVLPPVGGDTLWADMEAAYERLSPEVRSTLEGRRILHSYGKTLRTFNEYATRDGREALSDEFVRDALAEHPPVEHPLVRTNPQTGRRSLYMSLQAAEQVSGMADTESRELINWIYARATLPEVQVRLRWTPGTVAIWDNRRTLHYATADYHPRRRLMERVMVAGERPI